MNNVELSPQDPLARFVSEAELDEVDFDLDAAVARHQQLVHAGATPTLDGGLSRGLLAKLGIGLGITVAAVGVALVVLSDRPQPAPTSPASVQVETSSPTADPTPGPDERRQPLTPPLTAEPLPRAAPPAPVAPPPAAPAPAASESRGTSKPPSTRDDSGDELAAEMRGVAQARKALDSGEPERALRIARRDEARFRRGLFAQERQALIVFALSEMGRQAEARTAAEDFLRRYPGSAFNQRMLAIEARE